MLNTKRAETDQNKSPIIFRGPRINIPYVAMVVKMMEPPATVVAAKSINT